MPTQGRQPNQRPPESLQNSANFPRWRCWKPQPFCPFERYNAQAGIAVGLTRRGVYAHASVRIKTSARISQATAPEPPLFARRPVGGHRGDPAPGSPVRPRRRNALAPDRLSSGSRRSTSSGVARRQRYRRQKRAAGVPCAARNALIIACVCPFATRRPIGGPIKCAALPLPHERRTAGRCQPIRRPVVSPAGHGTRCRCPAATTALMRE